MTFGITLFIFITQFLWQHIDKLVGKGLDTLVIIEFFSYAILMLMPQSLPLGILLASLMTFGNMGERLELLAIKASGVSLMKIMKPMAILILFISIGSFVFQDKIGPILNVKVYALLRSIQKKAPAIDIPEGSFYSDMPGYSIYVKKKNLETGMLYDVIIYDLSSGTGVNNIAVNTCDSAIMVMGNDRDYLTLTMFDGEGFQNLKRQEGNRYQTNVQENIPYIREVFKQKEVVIPFNDELERMDESEFSGSQISKSLKSLKIAADSMRQRIDSLNVIDRKSVANLPGLNHLDLTTDIDSVKRAEIDARIATASTTTLNFDSVFNSYSQLSKDNILSTAVSEAENKISSRFSFYHEGPPKASTLKSMRLHQIYWHKMFTLSFACLIFFFIGAPLGSIIKKGGLGIPVIISVVLFIIYYIIGNIGYKMGRDGVWQPWQGEWLSTALLFPLGVFLTYKSMKESALFNVELYGRYVRNFLRIKSDPNWSPTKEADPKEILPLSSLNASAEQINSFNELDNNTLKDIVQNYKAYGYSVEDQMLALAILKERDTYFFDVRVNNYNYSYSSKLFSLFKQCSVKYTIPLYLVTLLLVVLSSIFSKFIVLSTLSYAAGLAYLIFYIKSSIYMSDFYKTVFKKEKPLITFLTYTLLLILYPIQYKLLVKRMDKDLERLKSLKY